MFGERKANCGATEWLPISCVNQKITAHHILVVDNAPGVSRTIKTLLEYGRHEVQTVASG